MHYGRQAFYFLISHDDCHFKTLLSYAVFFHIPHLSIFWGLAEILMVKVVSTIFLTHSEKVLQTLWSPLKAFVQLHIINGSY